MGMSSLEKMKRLCSAPIILACVVKCVLSSTLDDERNLQSSLMTGYNRNIRPTINQSEPTVVNVSFSIISVKNYDEKNSLFAFLGVFYFTWIAENMRWDPSQYRGVQHTIFRQQQVWIPFLAPGNSHSEVVPLGGEETYANNPVSVFYDGTNLWTTGNVYTVVCPADIKYYHLDTQICRVLFVLWQNTKHQVFLHSILDSVERSAYSENGLWDLTEGNVTVEEIEFDATQVLVLTFKIKRRVSSYIVNVIIPIIVIGLLKILVFVMPAESGERVSFAVTVLLAMTVFLTIVQENLPETAEPRLSYLSYFLLFDIINSASVTVCTIFGLKFYYERTGESVPLAYKRLIQGCVYCLHYERRKKLTATIKSLKEQSTENGNKNHDKTLNQTEITWYDVPALITL